LALAKGIRILVLSDVENENASRKGLFRFMFDWEERGVFLSTNVCGTPYPPNIFRIKGAPGNNYPSRVQITL
jgi:hypothetical protein